MVCCIVGNCKAVMYCLVKVYTVKPWKTEMKIVTKTGFYRKLTAKCIILALQIAPIGAFCNARMLYLTFKCG